jgi:hypothetical protein
MTADRMLAIESASVVDGDIVGDNLILTKHDGTQINAGNVRGPQGPIGPVGQDLAVIAASPVLDIGAIGQIRAGRQLTAQDFLDIGLSAPAGLWNLSDLTDASGNGRNLSNKGAVIFGVGVNGSAATSAVFAGLASQSLYILDTGAADPFRIKTGSWGCWFKTAKRGTNQRLLAKGSAADGNWAWDLTITAGNVASAEFTPIGTIAGTVAVNGISDVCDDRWHFIVATHDATTMRIYVDGVQEGALPVNGSIFSGNGPLNIGSYGADAGAAALVPNYGRIDEAFVTADLFSEDQIRFLYCAKSPHTLGVAPSRISLSVRRRRKGTALAITDFPTQPFRLHNFSAGSLGDEGSGGVILTNNGGAVVITGADGSAGNAFSFEGAQGLLATDAGLPATTTPRSFGCWFKTGTMAAYGLMVWGTGPNNMTRLNTAGSGQLVANNGTDSILSDAFVCDGLWHHAIIVEDNAAVDGVKRKLYLDGKLAAGSTVLNSITLVGANGFRIGQLDGGGSPLVGHLDSIFVCGYALTAGDIVKLYAKGSQDLGISPKNAGDHIERMDSANILAIFDTLESQHTINLVVAA